MIDQEGFNELSVTWRIYYSSKWLSKLQWPMTDKFVMGEWPSCRRGRSSGTEKCFRWGFQGRILVRSLKLSLFLWVLFIRRVFLFLVLLSDLASSVQASGLLVSTISWGSFWERRSVIRPFFANSEWDTGIYEKCLINRVYVLSRVRTNRVSLLREKQRSERWIKQSPSLSSWMVRRCIRLTRWTLVCEVIKYRLFQAQ